MGKRNGVGAGWRLGAGCVALLACAGCASSAYLNFDSDPAGAVIKTQDGVQVGAAPVSVRLGAIPVSAYQATNGWAPGKTYVACMDGYEPAYWSPRLSLAGVSRAIGLPHAWDYVFVLSPKAVDAQGAVAPPVAPSPPPPNPPRIEAPRAAELPLAPPAPDAAPSRASRQAGPGVASASAAGKGTLSVTAEPADAEILVDGLFIGNSPAALRLLEGPHLVEVRKEGFRAQGKEVHVTGESELTLRVRLLP